MYILSDEETGLFSDPTVADCASSWNSLKSVVANKLSRQSFVPAHFASGQPAFIEPQFGTHALGPKVAFEPA
jgi:hypothetical protein